MAIVNLMLSFNILGVAGLVTIATACLIWLGSLPHRNFNLSGRDASSLEHGNKLQPHQLTFVANVMVRVIQKFGLIAALSSIPFVMSLNGALAGVLVTVDERSQTMFVAADGIQLYHWKVSTGRPGYDTPTGNFRAFRMERDHFSKEWDDAPMPFSIFFTPEGHAIHGSLETKRLGKAASHGCIRLDPRNAAVLYDLVASEGVENTEVIVTNGDLPAVAEAQRQRLTSLFRQLAPTSASPGELY
jgi:L,D-transpeptidase catalytic domain